MDLGLRDTPILVTGGSGHIGRAIALSYAREGARVAFTYHHNEARAHQLAEEVRAMGGTPLALRFDLAHEESIRAAIARVETVWGGIQVLVNNAVQWQDRTLTAEYPFESWPSEAWQPVVRANLEGAIITTQAALGRMRTFDWGRIVFISTTLVLDGLPGSSAYTAAKGALHGLTRSLMWDVAPDHILTNVVMPGFTLTEAALTRMPEAVAQVAGQTPTGRLSTPEDVASLVTYLGSAANSHVNGEIIGVTGGL